MNQKEIAAPFVTQREDSFQNHPKFGWFRSTFLVESYENLLRNPLVSATSLDDHLLIFNFMALGIFLLSRSPVLCSRFLHQSFQMGTQNFSPCDHGMELLTFDDIDSPIVPVGESIHRLQFPALKNSGDLCFIVQTLDVLPVYDVYIDNMCIILIYNMLPQESPWLKDISPSL